MSLEDLVPASMSFRPFLVADRPSALRIIRGATPDLSANGLGIMTHANVTENVGGFIRNFPSSGGFYEPQDNFEADDETRYVTARGDLTQIGKRIRDRTTIICDSGAFQKEGVPFDDYIELFDRYEELGVDKGIINDELNDREGTIEEAREAISVYESGNWEFDLVGVAQGLTLNEYLACYEDLCNIGYDHIAIGGLLSKTGDRSGRFAQVSDSEFMESVLRAIREEYPSDWIFALGCHHPSRHALFEELELAGADYKGWLFKYNPQFVDTQKSREWRFQELRSFLRQNIFTQRVRDTTSQLLILPLPDKTIDAEPLQTAKNRFHGGYLSSYKKHYQSSGTIDVVFISENYGILPSEYKIPAKMPTESRIVGDPEQIVRSELSNLLRYRKYDEVLVAGGKEYRELCRCLLTITELNSEGETTVRRLSGPFGNQLQQLIKWLGSTQKAAGEFTASAQAD